MCVSRMCSSIESALSRTAAMPPWAQLEAPSRSSRLVTRATLWRPARWRAADMPARPLPMIRTSYAKWSRFFVMGEGTKTLQILELFADP